MTAGSVGYAIFYNLFDSELEQKAPLAVAHAVDLRSQDVENLIGIFTGASQETAAQAVAKYGSKTVAAAQSAFQMSASQAAALVFYVSIPLGLLALLPALFLPNMKRYLTDRVLTRTKSTRVGRGMA